MTRLIHLIVSVTFPWQQMANTAAIDIAFDSRFRGFYLMHNCISITSHSERIPMNNNSVGWFEIYVQDMGRTKEASSGGKVEKEKFPIGRHHLVGHRY